ncbi:MAG: DUF357 domain-containing protein [Nanoarchaeota archaeon]|nr:DUF357 domain-containing protein [Nanoarchaeota archaeon]
MKEEKAKELCKNGKIKLDMNTDKRIYFTVNSNEPHSVFFDKEKIGWHCDCRYNAIKHKTCSHVLAAKEFWESKMKNKAEKELGRVKYALKELKLTSKENKAQDLLKLINSYAKDAEHFYKKGDLLECFELCSYVFGLLDSAARLGFIDPGKARNHYKIDEK